jgi:hypothetical protein
MPEYYLSLVLLDINLIPKNDERKVFRVVRASLNEEFVPPAVQCLEWFSAVHVIYEYTTVGTTVERDAERLEAFLPSGIP